MKITDISLNRKVAVLILSIIFIFMGITSYITIPREAAPDIAIPYIIVSTLYIGVSPSDIEALVTQPIEREIQGISNIKEIKSYSSESASTIVVEFDPDMNMDDALQKVRDKVNSAKSKLPTEVGEPTVREINISKFPIMTINVMGSIGIVSLKNIAEELKDKIETVKGVLEVTVSGGLEREVKVNVDPERLAYYNLSLNDVISAIQTENVNIPGGTMDIGRYKYLLRIPGEFQNPELIKDLVVSSANNRLIYIRDLATVEYGFKERDSYARQNEIECVSIVITKRSGENIIRIANDIKKIIANEQKKLPSGVELNITGDSSKNIKALVDELDNNLIMGLILVLVILLIFLNKRMAIIVSLAIPLSMLITYAFIQIIGWTLNFIVLFSLILVLGMLVDDAIVVCENIYRHMEEGESALEAAKKGTHEVGIPVITATATIISAFLPLAFWPGLIGEFMKYLPITVMISLSASLFVSLTINPTMSANFLGVKKIRKSYMDMSPEELPTIIRIYRQIIMFTLKYPKLTLGCSVLLLFIVVILFGMFNSGVTFFPQTDPKRISINIEAPIGTNLETMNRITKEVEKHLEGFKDIETFVARVGGGGVGIFGSSKKPNTAVISVNMIDKDKRSQSSNITLAQIRDKLTHIAGAEITIQKEVMGPPTGDPISIEISGENLETLGKLADEVKRRIVDIPGAVDLKDDYISGSPEIKITIDREKAKMYGLSTAQIAGTIRTAINGTTASKYRVGEDEYDITVRLTSNRRSSISDIEELKIFSRGKQIPLNTFAKIEFSGGMGTIVRKDLKRVVTVSGNVQGRSTNAVIRDIKKRLEDFNLPPGYSISYTGEMLDQKEAASFLSRAFFIAILLITFVLVLEFNSFKVPILVMSGIILSIIGVLIGLLLTGTPFGIVMTGVGIISLAGVVVRNGIVLLDYVEVLRDRGVDKFNSIIMAGMIRLRPVFLTAFAAMLGLVPTAIGVTYDFKNTRWIIGGETAQFWAPLAITIISGLLFATVMTLVILPVMLYSWENAETSLNNTIRKIFKKDRANK